MNSKLYRLVSPFFPLFVLSLWAGFQIQVGPRWNPIVTGLFLLGGLYSLSRIKRISWRRRTRYQLLWMASLTVQILLLVAGQASYAFNSDDPRLGIKNVRKCVEIVESGLESPEFDSDEKETEIIKACREADAASVWTVLNHLPSTEKVRRSQVLPIVRACKLGVGGCFEMQIQKLTSLDYADAKKALQILKKCD